MDLTRAQLMTGQRMTESVHNAPQFALTTSADMTQALELREAVLARIEAEIGARPSVTSILVKIVADALKQYPRANASFADGRVKLHKHVNIGVAIGTEDGLVVPVIHDADQLSLAEITRQLKSLQEKAKPDAFWAERFERWYFHDLQPGDVRDRPFSRHNQPPRIRHPGGGAHRKDPGWDVR